MNELNQQAPTHQAPQIQKKAHGSKTMLFIFGAVIVSIGVGAYLLGANKTQTPVANNALPQPSVSPIDETANPDSIGANWKTYTNTEYKFLFKYPAEWKFLNDKTSFIFRFESPKGERILISVFDNPLRQDQTPTSWLEANFPSSFTNAFEKTMIDNQKALFSKQNQGAYVFTLKNRYHIFYAQCEGPGCNPGADPVIFNQILSTFKFISPEEQEIIESVSKDLVSTNTPGFQIEVKKLLGNYAYGVAGVPPQGFVWYAVKQNNQWKKIWDGQNSPSCAIMNNYNVPKEIYKDCSDNY